MKATPKSEREGTVENDRASFLKGLPEHMLLRYIILSMDKGNPAVDHRAVLADVIHKSLKHIDNVLNNVTYLSFPEWFAVQEASHTNLVTEWLCLNYPQKHCCSCQHKKED